jgi:hypothetical protein
MESASGLIGFDLKSLLSLTSFTNHRENWVIEFAAQYLTADFFARI